jgi:phage terminase large subunit-like protein
MIDLEETVEAELIRLQKDFRISAVVYDPSQFQRSATALAKRGFPMVEWPQTPNNMMLATQRLYELLTSNSLQAYPSPELRDHIQFASAETTGRGYRLMKGKHAKYPIDAAIALAMACYHAVEGGAFVYDEPIKIISPFGDFSGIRIPTIGDLMGMDLPAPLRD